MVDPKVLEGNLQWDATDGLHPETPGVLPAVTDTLQQTGLYPRSCYGYACGVRLQGC